MLRRRNKCSTATHGCRGCPEPSTFSRMVWDRSYCSSASACLPRVETVDIGGSAVHQKRTCSPTKNVDPTILSDEVPHDSHLPLRQPRPVVDRCGNYLVVEAKRCLQNLGGPLTQWLGHGALALECRWCAARQSHSSAADASRTAEEHLLDNPARPVVGNDNIRTGPPDNYGIFLRTALTCAFNNGAPPDC